MLVFSTRTSEPIQEDLVARRASAWLLTLSLVAVLPPIIERRPNWGMSGTPPAAEEQTPAVTSLSTALQAADPGERARAACELGMRGTDAIAQIPSLIALLADDARVESLECGDHDHDGGNWSIGGEPQQCLTSPAREAARALSRIGTKAIQPLMTALGDVRATMRRYAAIALGMLDHRSDGPAVQRLVATLGDADWQVRRSVVWALGEVGTATVVQPVAARLKDAHPRVREMAAHGLERARGSALRARRLIDAVKDSEWTVRREVVHAFGELESRSAVAVAEPIGWPMTSTHVSATWRRGRSARSKTTAAAPALRVRAEGPRARRPQAGGLGAWAKSRMRRAWTPSSVRCSGTRVRMRARWRHGRSERLRSPKAVAGPDRRAA